MQLLFTMFQKSKDILALYWVQWPKSIKCLLQKKQLCLQLFRHVTLMSSPIISILLRSEIRDVMHLHIKWRALARCDWLRAAGRQQASHLLKADCVCCNENYFSVSIHHIHSCSTLMECSWQLHYTGVVCYEVEIWVTRNQCVHLIWLAARCA